jgi:hypothetical protein
MRSRLLVLSSIIAGLLAAPSAVFAQHVFHRDYVYRHADRSRYDYDRDRYDRYDVHARVQRALQAAERADRAEARAQARSLERAESRSRAAEQRADREFFRRDLAARIHERIEASRARSRYRW